MGKIKQNKNLTQKHYKRVESSICEKCTQRCKEYERYKREMVFNKPYNGVLYKKV